VALAPIDAWHIRVVCDACRVSSAEVCGKRDLPVAATVAAVRKFKAAGWHHDAGGRSVRQKTIDDAERTGMGRWYCPDCGKKPHV
jgi:hypothetical protein